MSGGRFGFVVVRGVRFMQAREERDRASLAENPGVTGTLASDTIAGVASMHRDRELNGGV